MPNFCACQVATGKQQTKGYQHKNAEKLVKWLPMGDVNKMSTRKLCKNTGLPIQAARISDCVHQPSS